MAKIVMQYTKHINLHKHIVAGLIGLIGTITILSLTVQHGTGITPDSVVYISVARNFADHNTFIMYNGCLLYTSDAADERSSVDLGGRRIIKKKKNDAIEDRQSSI